MDDITEKIRSIPEGTSAEETMRLLVGDQEAFTGPAVKETMARLFQILDEDPEIDVSAGRGRAVLNRQHMRHPLSPTFTSLLKSPICLLTMLLSVDRVSWAILKEPPRPLPCF